MKKVIRIFDQPCCDNCEHGQYAYLGEKITYCNLHKCEVMLDGICREYKKAEEG